MNNSKKEKKINKILDRIFELQVEIRESLTKKSSISKEINVGNHMRKIEELEKELLKLDKKR